jgi:hypothetical protein
VLTFAGGGLRFEPALPLPRRFAEDLESGESGFAPSPADAGAGEDVSGPILRRSRSLARGWDASVVGWVVDDSVAGVGCVPPVAFAFVLAEDCLRACPDLRRLAELPRVPPRELLPADSLLAESLVAGAAVAHWEASVPSGIANKSRAFSVYVR